ncbi:hypothetical protein [Lacrimispora xylanisolvens]|uniref:hypothetical protein n=1 Tax=Lacrimispora xylanisolvens TaxID=384636 RepID=UPI0024027777
MTEFYAGLDVGGTNGRLKVSDPAGNVLGEFTAPGCSLNTDGAEKQAALPGTGNPSFERAESGFWQLPGNLCGSKRN